MSEHKYLRKNTYILISIILIAVLILLLSGCSKQEPESEEPAEVEDFSVYGDESLGIDAGVDESLRNYRSILIAGIDNGHRADIQLILCINKETGESRMITVNRDTYMEIADGETVVIDDRGFRFCKCNRAFEIGDKYSLMKELNRHLDLNIKEFIGVDWDCAAKLVDTLGGVECEIESQELLDAINTGLPAYEVDVDPIPGIGKQTLSGWQAVEYLRVRKYKGGNAFVRDDHNRAFVEALFAKAKTMSMDEISKVYDEVADGLDTNMSRNTLTDTFALISKSEIKNVGRWPYEYTTRYEPPDKYFNYRVPQSLKSNVIQLHADMFDQSDYSPSAVVEELNNKIIEQEEYYLE